jgi:hypothetical protein
MADYSDAPQSVYVLPFTNDEAYFTTDESEAREWHDDGYTVMEMGPKAVGNGYDKGHELFEPKLSFTDYLRENVFTVGTYVFDTKRKWGDVGVSEYDDGSGHINTNDMDRAHGDENVSVITVNGGKLILDDDR